MSEIDNCKLLSFVKLIYTNYAIFIDKNTLLKYESQLLGNEKYNIRR